MTAKTPDARGHAAALALLMALVAAVIAWSQGSMWPQASLFPQAMGQTLDDERRALATAKAQAATAAARATLLEASAARETSQADSARAQSAAVAARIQSAEANITAGEARVRLIEDLRNRQRARLAAKQAPASQLVAALQVMSRRPPALALVQPGSLSDLVHVRAVLSSILPVLRARTAGLRAELMQGRALRGDADRAVAALAQGRQQLVVQRAALVRLAALHAQESRKFGASAIVEQDRAIALGEEARDIVDLMGRIDAGAAVRDRLETLPGPLLRPQRPADPRADTSGDTSADPVDVVSEQNARLPYRLPVAGRIVTGLGEVSDSGIRSRGLTIATLPQAQVVAPAAGRVVFAGVFRGFGNIVIIDHGSRWTTLVTSLSALDVSVGDVLVQGSPVGRAATARPQVTVELRRNNQPVDITPFVSG